MISLFTILISAIIVWIMAKTFRIEYDTYMENKFNSEAKMKQALRIAIPLAVQEARITRAPDESDDDFHLNIETIAIDNLGHLLKINPEKMSDKKLYSVSLQVQYELLMYFEKEIKNVSVF